MEMIALAATALGFFGEMYRAPCMAMVSDVVSLEQRERAFGLIYWAVNLGLAIAPAVADAIKGLAGKYSSVLRHRGDELSCALLRRRSDDAHLRPCGGRPRA